MRLPRPTGPRLRIAGYVVLYLVVVAGLWLLFSATIGRSPAAPGRGAADASTQPVTRTYYIAADEVTWAYAPVERNNITNKSFDAQASLYTLTTDRQIGSIYRKAQYREYTDGTFTVQKSRPPEWQHLGLLGPVIRAVVGDTIVVHFKNNTTFPASIHPHGVFYDKADEGAPYNDNTGGADTLDDAVPPGGTYTYTWSVPERAGPGPGDDSSVLWMYHSHVNEISDVYSGLVGPIIVTARGKAKPDGSPIDVDREFVTMFSIIDENQSPYLDYNTYNYIGRPIKGSPQDTGASTPAGTPQPTPTLPFGMFIGPDGDIESAQEAQNDAQVAAAAAAARANAAAEGPLDPGDPLFQESNLKYSINGYIYGYTPGLVMHVGDRVRWYVFDMGADIDVHSPHWHGNTLTTAGPMGMRTDMTQLLPGMMQVLDMVPDDPGTWLLHCHVTDHMNGGMLALYTVLP